MRWSCLLLLLLTLASPLRADDLYTGEVPVESQDEAAKAQAMVAALKQVLVKVSGDPAAGERPEVQGALKDPAPLVQAFYFRQDVDRSGPVPALKLYFTANFEPRAITRLLSSTGLSQWARERPTLMAWVAADIEGAVALLPATQLAPLLRRANERGIRLTAASQAADEEGAASLLDVERGEIDRLRPIASRYGAPGVLAGRLYATRDGVVGRFAYGDGEREEHFEVRGADSMDALRAVADETANRMAARYAFAAADSTPAEVAAVVRGISSAADFARVHAYLASLSIIKQMRLTLAAGDTLDLNLSVAGGAERLRQIVALNAVLSVAGDGRDGAVVFDLR